MFVPVTCDLSWEARIGSVSNDAARLKRLAYPPYPLTAEWTNERGLDGDTQGTIRCKTNSSIAQNRELDTGANEDVTLVVRAWMFF